MVDIDTLVPRLETDRLVLRPHVLDDFPDCSAMWADPDVVRHISGQPSTKSQSWARLMRNVGLWVHLGYGYWAVERKQDGAFIGEVGFADYRRETTPDISGIPEAGWVFSQSAHGNGFATEAFGAALRWADQSLDATKTVCLIDPGHSASINVARKLGFEHGGNGQVDGQDTVFMSRHK